MKPRRRDVIGAGVLVVVLVGMVAAARAGRPAGPCPGPRSPDATATRRREGGVYAQGDRPGSGQRGTGGSQPCSPLDRAIYGALALVIGVVPRAARRLDRARVASRSADGNGPATRAAEAALLDDTAAPRRPPVGRRQRSVEQPLQVPRAGDPVEVDEREPAAADDLEVVPHDRLLPPRLLDPPAVAHLDRSRGARSSGWRPGARPRPAPRRSPGARAAAGSSRSCARAAPRPSPRRPRPAPSASAPRGSGASGSVISTRRTRSVPNAIASRASCQARRASRAACGVNSGELLPGRRLHPRELELQPRDGGRRRRLLQAGEQQALDRLGVGRRLGEALLEVEDRRGRRAGRRRGRG